MVSDTTVNANVNLKALVIGVSLALYRNSLATFLKFLYMYVCSYVFPNFRLRNAIKTMSLFEYLQSYYHINCKNIELLLSNIRGDDKKKERTDYMLFLK